MSYNNVPECGECRISEQRIATLETRIVVLTEELTKARNKLTTYEVWAACIQTWYEGLCHLTGAPIRDVITGRPKPGGY